MDKEECLYLLSTSRSNYAMGLLASYLLSTIDNDLIPSSLLLVNQQFPERKLNFDISQLKFFLTIEQNRIQFVSEFGKSIIRTFIHNTYELVLEYATESDQRQKIYDSELMTFTRLLRNTVGHTHKFSFRNKEDKQRLSDRPVRWHDKEITLEMEGEKIPMDLIDNANVIDLFDDIVKFVRTELR